VLELPLELPLGRARIAVTVTPEAAPSPVAYDAIEELRGLGKRLGSTLSVDRFLEMRREDIALEEAQYRRMFHHEEEA
jgi:hypothetical protein